MGVDSLDGLHLIIIAVSDYEVDLFMLKGTMCIGFAWNIVPFSINTPKYECAPRIIYPALSNALTIYGTPAIEPTHWLSFIDPK